MPSIRPSGVVPLFVVAMLTAWDPGPVAAEAPRRVLVLYSYTRLLPAHFDFENGFRQGIAASRSPSVELFDEFLDVPRFDGTAHLETVESYLREKYASRAPELVIAAGAGALRFLLERRQELFPGVPIVHSAVEPTDLSSIPPLPGDVVGVAVSSDPLGTIEQALRWHPGARRLVVVTGKAGRDREWEVRLRRELEAFEGRVEVEYLIALPTRALLRRLAELGGDAVVFTPGYFQDGEGRNILPRDSLREMAAASAAPVYSVFETGLGTGIVGGRMVGFEAMGREAGREAGEILGGVPPASVRLPAEIPAQLQVDWRQVERWGIDERSVPAGAGVHFRAPTLFEAHRTQVLVAAAAIALQTALIALLLVERRRRRVAELSEQGRRVELAHASRLAVAGELLGSIAHEINQPLGAILSNADAAELILESGGDRRAELAAILSSIRRDDMRASEVIRKLRALVAKHEIERASLDVAEVAREVESLLRGEARRREVTLEIQSTGAARALGDRVQLQQVLLNLLINAMDAVAGLPEQRRTIRLTVRGDDDRIDLSVRDRGHGIAPADLSRLFDSFFTTKSRGMGLGLAIARTIVEAHGGRIRAESPSDGGAEFHVELPAEGSPALAARGLA